MDTHTTIRSWGSILLGIACASATAAVLLEDVWRGAQITTTHGLSVLAIMVTIAAGHLACKDLGQWRLLSGLPLLVLAIAGTAYIVVASGARNAEHAVTRSAQIMGRNADRLAVAGDVKRARADHAVAKAEEAKECVKIGQQCAKRQRAVDAAWAHVLAQEHRRAAMGPVETVNGGWAHAARVLAAVPGIKMQPADIEGQLVLLMPFVLVILAEMGTILFISRGLGTYPPTTPDRGGQMSGLSDSPVPDRPSPTVRLPTYTETIRTIKAERTDGRTAKEEAHADLLTQIGLGKAFSQDELAERWNRPKQTISDWMREWDRAGLIPTRRTVGRFKMIAA